MSEQQPGSLRGARAIVTGGSKGIGFEIVRGLLEQGMHVTIAARDMAACHAARDMLMGAHSHPSQQGQQIQQGTCVCCQLDLEDPASIRRFASEQLADAGAQPVRLLVNNAGVMGVGYQQEQGAGAGGVGRRLGDGVMDRHMLVNHLGPFLLTQLLAPALTEGSRVVMVASRAHRAGSLKFDPATGELVQRPGVLWLKRYGDSKLANVLFTAELQRRLGPKGVACVSVSPGLVYTSLFHSLPWPLNHLSNAVMPLLAQTPAQGARTALHACLSADITGAPEQLFLHACKPQEPSGAARDAKLAKQLWDWSERFWVTEGVLSPVDAGRPK